MEARHPFKNLSQNDRLLTVGKDEMDAVLALLGNAAASTYTPTATAGQNVTSATGSAGFYARLGSIVFVAVLLSVRPAGSGACVVNISLPVSSTLTSTAVAGVGVYNAGIVGSIGPDTGTNTAKLIFTADSDPGLGVPTYAVFAYVLA